MCAPGRVASRGVDAEPLVHPELLEILVCPETLQPVHLADDALVTSLNDAAEHGTLRDRTGRPVAAPLDGALVREDGTLAYPIRDRIPVMLMEEAIRLPL